MCRKYGGLCGERRQRRLIIDNTEITLFRLIIYLQESRTVVWAPAAEQELFLPVKPVRGSFSALYSREQITGKSYLFIAVYAEVLNYPFRIISTSSISGSRIIEECLSQDFAEVCQLPCFAVIDQMENNVRIL